MSLPRPNSGNYEERRASMLSKAQEHRRRLHADHNVGIQAPCKDIGRMFGSGIGLYFKSLQWLQFLFFWMFLFTVPYLVVINITKFTDEQNRKTSDFGYKVHTSTSLNSFTFSAILDDNLDKGMLRYMKFDFSYPFTDKHPWIGKAGFLTLISALDAGSTLVFVAVAVFFVLRMHNFVVRLDKATHEVSDYTVVVGGLPASTTATQVGELFSRWGKVMDVVIIKDLGVILKHCSRMATLQDNANIAESKASFNHTKGTTKHKLKSVLKLQNSMKRINNQVQQERFPAHAAFVTFNDEHEKKQCLLRTPSNWFTSLFMRRTIKLKGRYRYWVRSATPPEDYIFENLGNHGWWRRAIVQLSVAIILLLCGGAITKLQRTDRINATRIPWDKTALLYAATPYAATSLLNDTIAAPAATFASAWQEAQGNSLVAATYPYTEISSTMVNATYDNCQATLPENCTMALRRSVLANVTMSFGSFLSWNSTIDYLLKEGTVFDESRDCYQYGYCNNGLLSHCYPCYCLGMTEYTHTNSVRDSLVVKKIKSQCHTFVRKFDVKTVAIKVGTSSCVWAINTMLQLILKKLVLFEKMDSRTSTEKLYAVYSYLAQLVNSTVVLLLVSAGSSDVEGLNKGGTQSLPRWLKEFIMNGSYTDFTPAWYQDVGTSLMVLLFINALLNPLLGYLPVIGKALNRRIMMRKKNVQHITQEQLNYASVGPKFMLHERIASLMLDITLAMIFGSGMPLMYGAALVGMTMHVFIDRHILLRFARKPNRYHHSLPMLLGQLLPIAAIIHCAVGLWMHTYYKGKFSGKAAEAFASGMETLDSASSSAGYGESTGVVKGSALWQRITQANGILLLILLCVIVAAVMIRLTLVEFFGVVADRIFKRMVTACCFHNAVQAKDDAVSYTEALTSEPRLLEGLATYRVEHHPMYESAFRSADYRIIWDQVYGRERYTRLVATNRRRHTFEVLPDLVLCEQDQAENAVVVADANNMTKKHRVTKEDMEKVAAGEIAGEVPEGYITALRAVSFEEDFVDEEEQCEDRGGDEEGYGAESIPAVLQPYGAPWLDSAAELRGGHADPMLEMTEVRALNSDGDSDDSSSSSSGGLPATGEAIRAYASLDSVQAAAVAAEAEAAASAALLQGQMDGQRALSPSNVMLVEEGGGGLGDEGLRAEAVLDQADWVENAAGTSSDGSASNYEEAADSTETVINQEDQHLQEQQQQDVLHVTSMSMSGSEVFMDPDRQTDSQDFHAPVTPVSPADMSGGGADDVQGSSA